MNHALTSVDLGELIAAGHSAVRVRERPRVAILPTGSELVDPGQPLRPGDVSQVVESGYGFHLFKLEQRIQPHAPDERRSQLDDRRSQLTEEFIAQKNQQAVDAALAALLDRASIQIRDATLGFTYTGQLRHN